MTTKATPANTSLGAIKTAAHWWSRWSTEAQISSGLILAFVLIICGAAASYRSSFNAIETSKSLEHSILFSGSLETLSMMVRDLYDSAREYALTGRNPYRVQFENAASGLEPNLFSTKALCANDRHRLQDLELLHTLIMSIKRDAQKLVETRQNQGAMEAVALLKGDNGNELMRLLHNKITAIQDEERALLQSQISDYESSTTTAMNTYSIVCLLVIVFFFGLGASLYHYMTVIRKAIEADQRVLSQVVQHAPIGVIKLSNDLLINDVNPVFCQYMKESARNLKGKKITDVVPQLPKIAFVECRESGSGYQVEDLAVPQEGLLERYWDITLWPIREQSEIEGFILLVVDVTEEMNLSNQREVFAQTLTHDMKTPLIAADRIFEALLDKRVGGLGKSQRDLLLKLKKNNKDVLKMVKDVLEVSRYKQHSLVLTFEPVDFKSTIEECVQRIEEIANLKSVVIRSHFKEPLQYVLADRMAVEHLVMNLLENAVKFSPNDSVIELFAGNKENNVFLEVQDQGEGMTDEDQKKLFQSSWQGDLGKTAPSGTGLGLYLCHHIVLAHKGRLSCSSNLGTGSTFTVHLPACQPKPEQATVLSEKLHL